MASVDSDVLVLSVLVVRDIHHSLVFDVHNVSVLIFEHLEPSRIGWLHVQPSSVGGDGFSFVLLALDSLGDIIECPHLGNIISSFSESLDLEVVSIGGRDNSVHWHP